MRPQSASLLAGLRAGAAAAMDLVLPRPCPGCGGSGPWCAGCDATLGGRPRRVALPEAGSQATDLPPVWGLTRYTDPVRSAILAGKERGRRDLPPLLGLGLGRGLLRLLTIGALPEPVWLVPAPSRRAAARARGGDPVTAMAGAAARCLAATGHPTGVAPCLLTAGSARDSVGLDAAGRAANLADRVRWVAAGAPPAGVGVVLVDDVLTSGATATAACRVLREHAAPVHGVVVLAAVPGWISTR